MKFKSGNTQSRFFKEESAKKGSTGSCVPDSTNLYTTQNIIDEREKKFSRERKGMFVQPFCQPPPFSTRLFVQNFVSVTIITFDKKRNSSSKLPHTHARELVYKTMMNHIPADI